MKYSCELAKLTSPAKGSKEVILEGRDNSKIVPDINSGGGCSDGTAIVLKTGNVSGNEIIVGLGGYILP